MRESLSGITDTRRTGDHTGWIRRIHRYGGVHQGKTEFSQIISGTASGESKEYFNEEERRVLPEVYQQSVHKYRGVWGERLLGVEYLKVMRKQMLYQLQATTVLEKRFNAVYRRMLEATISGGFLYDVLFGRTK
ncbi:MAG: hypothetical protein LBD74_04065 [Spirochaetaceae bacterium]|jgi:GH15 family glucan-1,4-alpha-glucosidase|nr:hypothetical protein [Spirochaetaceae bacterium]